MENRFGDDTRPNNRSNKRSNVPILSFLAFQTTRFTQPFDVRADRGSVRLQPAELPQPGASPSGAFTLEIYRRTAAGCPAGLSARRTPLLVLPAENGFT